LTKDEALKLALEALENLYDTCDWHGDDGKEAMVNAPKAIAAVKEVLAQPAQEQWLEAVSIKIEAALLSHRLSMHRDSDDPDNGGNGLPLVDALCCGQTSLDVGKREVEDIVEAIYHVLDATAPQPAQEPPSEWAGIKAILDEYGLQAIDFVADWKAAQAPATIFSDGSAFGVMSFPLPDDHWLYAPNEYRDGEYEPIDLPKPILTHALRDVVVAAMRYAVRGATMMGQDTDFDPDALVQNAVYALCGPFTSLDDDDVQVYAQPAQEPHNFCPRCGKRTPDPTTIHTCTPPQGDT